MVEKKLLTLVCVAGILACGACLLPPLPRHEPPPPPVRTGLNGVQSIQVVVTNASPSHHLDSAALARRIAETFNAQSWTTKVNAHVGKEPENEDAVLAVTVLSETVEPAKTGRMTFLIKDSATLTRLDGALAWRETEVGNWISRDVVEQNQPDAWKLPGLVDGVSERLVFRMFYVR